MHGSDTSVLDPQALTSVKFTTSWRASNGVVWRPWPLSPQLRARTVSPTTITSTCGRVPVPCASRASGATISRARTPPPPTSRASTPAVDSSRLAGVTR